MNAVAVDEASKEAMRKRRDSRKFFFTKSMLQRIGEKLKEEDEAYDEDEDEDDEEGNEEEDAHDEPASEPSEPPTRPANGRTLKSQVRMDMRWCAWLLSH